MCGRGLELALDIQVLLWMIYILHDLKYQSPRNSGTRIHIYIHIHMYMSTNIYTHTHVYVCHLFLDTCTYVHTYKHMHIHTVMQDLHHPRYGGLGPAPLCGAQAIPGLQLPDKAVATRAQDCTSSKPLEPREVQGSFTENA